MTPPGNRWLRLVLCVGLGAVPAGQAASHEDLSAQIARLTRRIEQEPPSAALYLRRGELHRLQDDTPAALNDYHQARTLDPDLADVDLCLARMYLDQDRSELAGKVLDRLLKRRPDDAEALLLRGQARHRLGHLLAAAADISRAIDLIRPPGRPRPEHYLDRARLLAAAGPSHLDAALQGLDEGLARLGEPVTLQLLAIELEQRRGRFEAALQRLSRIQAQSQRSQPWSRHRQEILAAARRHGKAVAVP